MARKETEQQRQICIQCGNAAADHGDDTIEQWDALARAFGFHDWADITAKIEMADERTRLAFQIEQHRAKWDSFNEENTHRRQHAGYNED